MLLIMNSDNNNNQTGNLLYIGICDEYFYKK